MTHEEFDRLVAQVENRFRGRPAALRYRVLLWALLGYGGLLLSFLIILAVAALLVGYTYREDLVGRVMGGLVALLILLGGGWMTLRALCLRLPEPEGEELKRAELPGLFDLLDRLQSQMNSVGFDRVLLVGDCNAAVVQSPRLGLLGWPRNFLLIGLPLCEGVSAAELRAVLAHEFAHLSREDGRLSHWLYRLRRSWDELHRQLSENRNLGFGRRRSVTYWFFDWFWPRFNAHAFVLSRINEFEADGQAARVTDRDALASALMRLRLLNHHLEQTTWPEIWQLANTRTQPPPEVYQLVSANLRQGPKPEDLERWTLEAFRIYTSTTDTHPCLTQRLAALQASAPSWSCKTSIVSAPSAAEELLGPHLPELRRRLGQRWTREVTKSWNERHARAGALESRLTALDRAVPLELIDVDALWDRAWALMDLKGGGEAEDLLRQILRIRPSHQGANFHLGRLLLEKGDAQGESLLERVMEDDEGSVPRACELLHDYYRRAGRADRAVEIETRMDRYHQDLRASQQERSSVGRGDELIPHGLSTEELEPLRRVLQEDPAILRADLVQKRLRSFPKQRMFVLIVYPKPAWHRLPSHDREWAVVHRISALLNLPGRTVVLPPSGTHRPVARQASRVPSAEVWRR